MKKAEREASITSLFLRRSLKRNMSVRISHSIAIRRAKTWRRGAISDLENKRFAATRASFMAAFKSATPLHVRAKNKPRSKFNTSIHRGAAFCSVIFRTATSASTNSCDGAAEAAGECVENGSRGNEAVNDDPFGEEVQASKAKGVPPWRIWVSPTSAPEK
jgi:hypothetical protein